MFFFKWNFWYCTSQLSSSDTFENDLKMYIFHSFCIVTSMHTVTDKHRGLLHFMCWLTAVHQNNINNQWMAHSQIDTSLNSEQWLTAEVTSYYHWNSKRWMLEDETWRTCKHVMDPLLKSDVNEGTRSAHLSRKLYWEAVFCAATGRGHHRSAPVAAGPAFVCLLGVIMHSRLWVIMR